MAGSVLGILHRANLHGDVERLGAEILLRAELIQELAITARDRRLAQPDQAVDQRDRNRCAERAARKTDPAPERLQRVLGDIDQPAAVETSRNIFAECYPACEFKKDATGRRFAAFRRGPRSGACARAWSAPPSGGGSRSSIPWLSRAPRGTRSSNRMGWRRRSESGGWFGRRRPGRLRPYETCLGIA